MKIAYFDCFSGVSGDMIIASLLECGLKIGELRDVLKSLGIRDLKVDSRRVLRRGLRGRQFIVKAGDSETFRNLSVIEKKINKSPLIREIKEKALKIFDIIAKSEAKAHGIERSKIHLHEIGACDTIVDVVGALWGVHRLGIKEIYTSPIPLGSGIISTTHGKLPIPAPATAEILRGYPVTGTYLPGEVTTPTGAAILSVLSKGTRISFPWRIEKIGYGAGQRDGEIPNLLRLFIGRREECLYGDRICIIETNIDNMDPQAYELIMERAFDAGALDVFITNIIMKKGRPAHKLTVLSPPDRLDILARVLFENIPTLGIRMYYAERKKLLRRIRKFKTPWGIVRIKEKRDIEGKITLIPESDDVIKIARANSLSYQDIYKKILDTIS